MQGHVRRLATGLPARVTYIEITYILSVLLLKVFVYNLNTLKLITIIIK